MKGRHLPPLVLALALLALANWKAVCVLAGPDVDTDAYAHHMIARAILADPRDLAVHWVWLPLCHYAQVPLVALGVTMQGIRWLSVAALHGAPVVALYRVRSPAPRAPRPRRGRPSPPRSSPRSSPRRAPSSCRWGPPRSREPLFALLVLGVAMSLPGAATYGTTAVPARPDQAAMLRATKRGPPSRPSRASWSSSLSGAGAAGCPSNRTRGARGSPSRSPSSSSSRGPRCAAPSMAPGSRSSGRRRSSPTTRPTRASALVARCPLLPGLRRVPRPRSGAATRPVRRRALRPAAGGALRPRLARLPRVRLAHLGDALLPGARPPLRLRRAPLCRLHARRGAP